MIYPFGIGIISGSYIRCFHLEPEGNGFKPLWCSKSVIFLNVVEFQFN
jgi:hypothetical protein